MTNSAPQFTFRPGRRATLMLNVRDHAHHGSLMVNVIRRARKMRMAGATAFEAREGYGVAGRLHQNRTFSDDFPVSVVIVDAPERVDSFLNNIADLLTHVTVIIEDVEIVDH